MKIGKYILLTNNAQTESMMLNNRKKTFIKTSFTHYIRSRIHTQ